MATNITVRSGGASDMSRRLRQARALAGEMMDEALAGGRRMTEQAGALMSTMQPEPMRRATSAGSTLSVPCCPPEAWCPPTCILEITRHAHPGEVIVVPFKLRNTTGVVRRYHVGLRPLADEQGNPAPTQPTLDKLAADVNPSQSVLFEMRLDLSHSAFSPGRSFETMIVVREQKYNQNICFRLVVDPYTAVPVAEPYDEKLYERHFVSWHHHFYCDEPARGQGVTVRPAKDPPKEEDPTRETSKKTRSKKS